MLLVPVRYFIVPRLGFTKDEMDVLDGAVASPFVSVFQPKAPDQTDNRLCSPLRADVVYNSTVINARYACIVCW